MPEVSIKFFMPLKVGAIEKEGPRPELEKALNQLSQSLKEKKVKLAGPAMGVFHDDPKSFDPQKARYDVCFPISGKIKGEGEVKGKELEKGAFACITHSGPIEKLPDTYKTILKWIEENGYMIAGPTREIYQKGIGEAGGSPQECLIEVQLPVRK